MGRGHSGEQTKATGSHGAWPTAEKGPSPPKPQQPPRRARPRLAVHRTRPASDAGTQRSREWPPLAHVSEGCKKPQSWGPLQRAYDPRGGANSGDVAQSRLGHSVASPHRGDRTPGHQLLLPVTARVPAGTTRHLEKPEPARALSLGTQCGPTRAWAPPLEQPPGPPPLPVAPRSSRLCRVALRRALQAKLVSAGLPPTRAPRSGRALL